VATAGTDRQQDWITVFVRSPFGKSVMRRVPLGIQRGLFTGRRWERRIVAQVRSRWHRSLQLRVVSTTLVLSALVIAVLGFFLVQSIAEGLLNSAQSTDRNQVQNGASFALNQPSLRVLDPPNGQSDALSIATALQRTSGQTGSYLVFVQLTGVGVAGPQWAGQRTVNITATIPQDLMKAVKHEQIGSRFDNDKPATPWSEPTVLTYGPGYGASGPALAVGEPLGQYYQLYYVFPFTQQQSFLLLIQRVLVGVGLALVVLLAAIASLVTRWVVLPVRHAAQAAQRLSAGHLEERMQVLGVDDLAALATSFNEMAASLQGKLAELEDLSSVQRQFVSDVSHELRAPLTTIRMAADLLFESRQELDPVGGRSVELLQSQLERFETMVVDLLEISRYDAGAATLEADLIDVCDLVRRSADDAQQLAERKGVSPRWTGAGWSASCATSWSTRSSTAMARTWWSPPRSTAPRWPSRSGTTAWGCAQASSSGSSNGSGGPTRPGPAPPAAPAWAWPSRWRTRSCTAAGCRPGASGARARCSG
jgi:two-component system sensor histidine kinase MtrB